MGLQAETDEASILTERVLLKRTRPAGPVGRTLFPTEPTPPETILSPKTTRGVKTIVNKATNGNENFYDETDRGWDHTFTLGPRRSALANLPEDESKFPVSTWLKRLLVDGIQQFVLNSLLLRRASPHRARRAASSPTDRISRGSSPNSKGAHPTA